MFFKDLKVIELASVLAGPTVGQFFAELGAKVVKVENPAGGDVTRHWKLAAEDKTSTVSAYFAAANWGKQSISLNLANRADVEALYSLVADADVVIASFKPGDAQKMGVDWLTLKELNPRLIYGQISGYGPASARVGYDAIIQAEAGFMHMNGTPETPPVKMPVALVDLLAAHQLKEALLLALLHREKTGEGSLVEVSLFDAAVASLANQATNWLNAGHIPQRMGSEHPNIVPYGKVFSAKGGLQLVLAVGSDKQWEKLCEILNLPPQAAWATNSGRVAHREIINKELEHRISQQDIDALMDALHKAHIPAGRINNIKEVFDQQAAQHLLLQQGRWKGVRTFVAETSFIPRNIIGSPPEQGT
jgi:crotonobetainyl-CoA:carnitine CoA-transferase CaiB-like acyl-CoA transferase